ncbi:PEP-CTERM sorting domain-containing protein [Aureliella helgolandensis]|uniref:Ice-binding protein C-terminal domain-containing protein n=1 Tax=Aureliella helgolandensis TaxID=2527968 RepID=A0A518GG75_9BACT|nr:PEP-CTERM sorting domain-containing protein [Aureliella helgolandensis]QDV27602.1 hypothetical protein Q31a_59940 [Aureliella helgolandensis]
MLRAFAITVFGLLALAVPSDTRAAITIAGYTDATNDRFTNSDSFIGESLDFSGVGMSMPTATDTRSYWATAISPNVVITANHFHAPNGSSVVFYANNDPSSTPITRTIVSGVKIGSNDLYLSVLNANLPSSIAFYDFAEELLTEGSTSSSSSIIGKNAFVVGRSPFNEAASSTDDRFAYNDQAVGRNIIDRYAASLGSLTNAGALLLIKDLEAAADFVPFEAQLATFDSGAPMFVEIDGRLVLVGTNHFVFPDVPQLGDTIGSGIAYTGNQAAAIRQFISVSAVPEPSSGTALLMLGLSVFVRRRNRG